MSTEVTTSAEAVLLGRMIEGDDPDFVDSVVTALSPAAFTTPAHRAVFNAAATLARDGNPVDLPALADRMEKVGSLAESGGPGMLASLTSTSLSAAASAPQLYLTAMADAERMRRLRDGLGALLARSQDGQISTADDLHTQVAALFSEDVPTVSALTPMRERMTTLYETLQRRAESDGSLDGVPTGWKDLDGGPDSMAILQGLKPGWLTILGARPGTGKTTAVVDWVRAACAAGKGVVLFSLEQPAAEITEQLVIAECANINRAKFKDPNELSEAAWDKVSEAMARVASWPLIIDGSARTLPQMRRVAAEASRTLQADGYSLDLAVQDFIQLTEAAPDQTHLSPHHRISAVANGFKAMAKDMGLSFVAAAQLGRESANEDRMPRLTDLKESGSLEEAADVVIMLHRPYAADAGNTTATPDQMQALVSKFRHGRAGGLVSRSFLGEFARTSEPMPIARAEPPAR
ncbi:MAG: AAA family ATPase [Tomitella sp.]|nr:AAA family ATPase [Tomitella sp.]